MAANSPPRKIRRTQTDAAAGADVSVHSEWKVGMRAGLYYDQNEVKHYREGVLTAGFTNDNITTFKLVFDGGSDSMLVEEDTLVTVHKDEASLPFVSVKRKPEGDGATVDPVDLRPLSSAASPFAGKVDLAPLAPQDLVVLKFRSTQRTNLNLRSCLLLRRGCLSETDFSEAKAPGWWLLHGGTRKFLRDNKIIARRSSRH